MLDNELKTMIDEVKDGRMDRRAFIQRMIGLRPHRADGHARFSPSAASPWPRARHPTSRPSAAAAVR